EPDLQKLVDLRGKAAIVHPLEPLVPRLQPPAGIHRDVVPDGRAPRDLVGPHGNGSPTDGRAVVPGLVYKRYPHYVLRSGPTARSAGSGRKRSAPNRILARSPFSRRNPPYNRRSASTSRSS